MAEENHICVIDKVTRKINMHEACELFGVEHDKKVERIKFECAKEVGDENLDLTQCSVYIAYENAGAEPGLYEVKDITADGDVVRFSWLLDEDVTLYKGNVTFIVYACKINGVEREKAWNTIPAQGVVEKGLKIPARVEKANPAIIESLLVRIAALEKKSVASRYPDWSHLKWYVLGDSLTDPAGSAHTSKFYYEYIREKTGIQVIVDGMGGTGYYAGASTNRRFADRVPNIPADVDIVTIFGSVNDIGHGFDNYKPAMSDALKIFYLERPGLPVIMIPPSPCKGYQKRGEEWKGYCDTLELIALNYNARYVDDMFKCPPFDPNSAVDLNAFFTKDLADGIHPDENGHEAIARYVYNAMLQELALK